MKSIRRYLLLTLLPAMLLLTLAAGLVVFFAVRGVLLARLDAEMSARVRTLATLTIWTHEGLEFDFADVRMPEYDVGPNAEYFEVRVDGRGVLQRSRSAMDRDLLPGSIARTLSADPAYWNAPLPDGRPGRYVALRFQPQWELDPASDDQRAPESLDGESLPPPAPESWATALVAQSSLEVDRPLHALMMGLLGAGAMMAVFVTLAVTLIVHRGLRPLDDVAAAVEAIDDNSLATRIQSAGVPVELQGVCGRLNQMFERLETAFERERRFSGAAAHELRTPVAELRAIAEVAERWPHDAAAQANAMRQVVDISAQMSRMIDTLLALARSDRGAIVLREESVALKPMVDAALRDVAKRARARDLVCRAGVRDELRVIADRAALASILANLLGNAVEYAPTQSLVTIDARRSGDGVDLVISNRNPGINKSDVPRMFEPFWRGDAAHADHAHSGLGLAVVGQLAAAMNMRFEIALDQQDRQIQARLKMRVAAVGS